MPIPTWPYDGDIPVGTTALINIDWQVDFCGEGGYVDAMGYDLSLTRTPLGPAQRVLRRRAGRGAVHPAHQGRPPARPVGSTGQQAMAFGTDRRRDRIARAVRTHPDPR